MPRPLGMLVLAALLAAPLSVASSSAHADFQTKGIIELPAESRADFHPFAFYLGQTSDVTGTLRTPELRVTLFERHDVYVEAGLTFIKTQKEPVKSRSFTLHNASASFSPGAGLLGLYPGSDGEMHVEPSEAWTAEPSPFSSLPHGQPSVTDGPDLATYSRTTTDPHFDILAAGISKCGSVVVRE